MTTDTAAWLIDGRLLSISAANDGKRLDYKKLRSLLESDFKYSIRQALYYDTLPETESARKFQDWLRREGKFEVKPFAAGRKETECPHCSETIMTRPQKCVDVAIAMDLMRLAATDTNSKYNYNPILLSSGDRDFRPVLDYIRGQFDKDIVLVAPGKSVSAELIPLCNSIIDISTFYSKIASDYFQTPPATEAVAPQKQGLKELASDILRQAVTRQKEFNRKRSEREDRLAWGFVKTQFMSVLAKTKDEQAKDRLVEERFVAEYDGGSPFVIDQPLRQLLVDIFPKATFKSEYVPDMGKEFLFVYLE